MSTTKKIRTALISVYNKDGIGDIVKKLHELGVELLSTGGTQTYIESLGLPCKAVEDLTGYPSILGGRVKTLHPKVFGGILARRDNESDKADSEKYEIAPIDLVIVDLYPFEATVAGRKPRRHHRKNRHRRHLAHPRRSQELQRRSNRCIRASVRPAPGHPRHTGAETTIEQRRIFAR